MDPVKIAVTGAAGQIGYALLFRIASGEMFGPETPIDLRLIEIPQGIAAARGVEMELQDCAFPLLKNILVTDDLRQGFDGVDWTLLVGSVPRKAGMERGDLLKVNGDIFVTQGKILDAVAQENCKILVVGNPCNTNAYIAKAMCRRISEKNFFALTMLDQNRAAAQLALKAKVEAGQVSHMAIWGNHSATQYPDFYQARIQGRPVLEVIPEEHWFQTAFLETVQKRGAAVIAARGKSSAASAANAVVETVQCLTRPTPPGEFFSVAVCSDGSYGVEPGIIFGFPVRSDGQRWEIVQGLELTPFSRKQIESTLQELVKEKEVVEKELV